MVTRKHARSNSIRSILKLKGILLLFFGILIISSFLRILSGSLLLKSRAARVNIVLTGKPFVILSLAENETAQNAIFVVPQNILVAVPFGYGEYTLEKVPQLGDLENNKQLLTETLGDLFGMDITGWISRNKSSDNTEPSQYLEIVKNTFGFNIFFDSQTRSSFNLIDKLLLSFRVNSLKSNNLTSLDLMTLPLLTEKIELPDGTRITTLNPDVLDSALGSIISDKQIREEGLTIEVNNTTGAAKAGQKFSRIITNLGGKVISISNSEDKNENCIIKTIPTHQNKKIIKTLQSFFGCEINLTGDPEGVDVIIYLGRLFGMRWQTDTN